MLKPTWRHRRKVNILQSSKTSKRPLHFHGIYQDLIPVILLLPLHWMSQRNRLIHGTRIKQHGVEAPGWAVDGESPIAAVICDSSCLEKTGCIEEEEKTFWRVKRLVNQWWIFLLDPTSTILSHQFHCLNHDVKGSVMDIMSQRSLIWFWGLLVGILSVSRLNSASVIWINYFLLFFNSERAALCLQLWVRGAQGSLSLGRGMTEGFDIW